MLEDVPIWLVIIVVVLIIAAINLAVWLFARTTGRKIRPGSGSGSGSDSSSSGL